MTRRRVVFAVVLALWGASWLFARDIIKGLESLGVLSKRGLVFSDESDFAFSLVVLTILLALLAIWRLLAALGGRVRTSSELEDDPRYGELLRQKELLLRDIKEVEFDRDLRKISDEDYRDIDRRLRGEATTLLKELDEVDPVRLYGDRIREDLQKVIEAGGALPASRPAATTSAAEAAWRREVLDRPLYRELAPVLGERDLLLAALRDIWIEAADVDRQHPAASILTINDRKKRERSSCTLGELRARLLAELEQGDDRETMRLAELAGVSVQATGKVILYDLGGTREECPPDEFRQRVLHALSRELAA